MRKILLALLLTASMPAVAGTKDDVVAIDPTVRVDIIQDGKTIGHGSGVYIADGMVLTAAHVAHDGDAWAIVGSDGVKVDQAKVIVLDIKDDLAVLQIDKPGRLRPAAVNCDEPAVGSVTHSAGYPLDLGRVTVWGRIASEVHNDGPWRSIVILDSTVERGMSGGPVFDDHNNVVGITVGMHLSPPLGLMGPVVPLTGFTYAVSAPAVCRAIEMATATS